MKKKNIKWGSKFLIVSLMAVMFTACSKKVPANDENPTIVITPTNEAEPTKTPDEIPTSTPEPTKTLDEIPTSTPEPTKTLDEIPTSTPEATKAPTKTPTKTPEVTKAPTKTPTKTPEATKAPTKTPTKAPEATKAPTKTPTKAPEATKVPTKTPTQIPEADDNILDKSLEEIMEKVYENVTSDLPMIGNVEITKENSQYYLGIENMEFEEAMASEAMITSVAYSVCLVRVSKDSDVEAVKKEIASSVNPNKWICVGVNPENVLIDNIENVILLVMTNNNPQEIMDSFLSLAKK